MCASSEMIHKCRLTAYAYVISHVTPRYRSKSNGAGGMIRWYTIAIVILNSWKISFLAIRLLVVNVILVYLCL